MIAHGTRRNVIRAAALVGALVALAGCASWQGPRIDPTGERFFIWPGDPPPTFVGPPGVPAATVVGPPVVVAPPPAEAGSPGIPAVGPIAPATGIGAPMGNVLAPPVYSDPAPIAPPAVNPYAPNVIATPAAEAASPRVPGVAPLPLTTMRPAGVPVVATPLGTCAPAGVPYLRLTPNGLMAPVGTEVVLKAGVADCNGALLVNRRVDWGITGAGQFTEMGTTDQVGWFAWPWQVPRRVAANYAIGTTAMVESTLYRGTPDPNDDVPISRGESWVTVSSACEGTSLVTAYTPTLDNYNRVTTQIYWVDAQFFFPPSTTAEPGRPHVLTTTVTRKSDNAPLAGWKVRYDVANGASLGYEGGNSVEATTDANGRASVEVSPVDAGGGTTNVGISIFRPPVAGAPQLGLGRGNATITWGAAAAGAPMAPAPAAEAASPSVPVPSANNPYAPNTYAPSPYAPSLPPPPSGSLGVGDGPARVSPGGSVPSDTPATRGPDPYTPPAATGAPKLQLEMSAANPSQVGIGEFVSFNLTITNVGNAPAGRVKVHDEFAAGLKHPNATPGMRHVDNNDTIKELAPNQSANLVLTFEVVAPGQQCHTVTVSTDGAQPVSKQGCVNGVGAALDLRINGPRTRAVGEAAEFNVVVKNGEYPAKNVQVVVRFDPALEPEGIADLGHQRLADGSIALNIGDIGAREQRQFRITTRCKVQMSSACADGRLTADGATPVAYQQCVEILPPAEAGGLLGD